MALRWKPTIPEDNNPDDQTGSLRHYPFAQVVRVQSGPDQGRFRWYLNELPGATTIKKQGVEESLEAAKQAADEQFRSWLTWTGLAPAVTEPETVPVASSTASPAPSPPRPVDPPEQRLPRYLAPLCEGLAAYVEEHGPALDSLYRWKIPAVPAFVPFERDSDSLPKANARLKRALSAAWHTQPERQFEIAEWYVAKWGGVHNRPEKLWGYIAAAEDELAGSGTAGVASWSKLLAVRDPDRFAIFDARVSVALNALQIVQDHERPIFFPPLPSKNTKIGKFHEWMKARDHGDAHKAFPARAYGIYLRILSEVARQLELAAIDEVEMLLFAQAEDLALQAMSHPSDAALPAIAAE
ncbi:hypothetical protein BB934_41460 (plasmid) [Microvirga ossetica]|uniref:Uncharacterized protein n=1 Tax=Microvirga ossetica TaxID=1882682 RepID=A0A1B2EXB6_9HYPH|nr:hypothetical protein [Microvirga ossetica]ANY84639.1 hypothetical protein BB934_41460 [Microvirga ossetica]